MHFAGSEACLRGCPAGPETYDKLCSWPEQFASSLLHDNQVGAQAKQNFEALYGEYDWRLSDFYAGTGNGTTSLKKQAQALASLTGGVL